MKLALAACCIIFLLPGRILSQLIDRKKLVERHSVHLTKADTLSSLSVGNGRFAFTVDITGLQSFPEYYAGGIPLGTQSEWGWHSFPNVNNYKFSDALKSYHLNGRDVTYAIQWGNGPETNRAASDFFRQNPHRLQLGNIGLEMFQKNGRLVSIDEIRDVRQTLNMWTGEIRSAFTVGNEPVTVITYGHQQQDAIAVNISSPLLQEGRLRLKIRLPYPTGNWADMGVNHNDPDKHNSVISSPGKNSGVIRHTLDTTTYYIAASWAGKGTLKKQQAHYFIVQPGSGKSFEFSCAFSDQQKMLTAPSFKATAANSQLSWRKFWSSGGAIDFSGSKDPRAHELERRMVLSQYLTKIQCAGDMPPQETGLTYNSWFGKPHLEMHWWHAVHFALWGRPWLLEQTMGWYFKAKKEARAIAQRQGYGGVRWQKMTDPEGRESPSSVGAFLIWQQPHIIYFSELIYRAKPGLATLTKYKDLVFTTADFMASFAFYDSAKGAYILGKGVIPAQERFRAEETFNPTYELAYWNKALRIAQQWKERLHLPRDKKWDTVLNQLSPLPVADNKYLFAESAPDSYTNPAYKTDHPAILGALGMLPLSGMMNRETMAHTFNWSWDNWSWEKTWGWDFPLTAMTAARLGFPERAVDALLMNIRTNTYLPNGHNYQSERLPLYLPGNGGLLAAMAMMVAGFDDAKGSLPGIPKNGNWRVRWEGLKKMP